MNDVHPTAFVGQGVQLGAGVSIGAFSFIDGETLLGDGTVIGTHCVLNDGSHGRLEIGRGGVLRSHTVVYGGSRYGSGFNAGHHAILREGLTVGNDVKVGTFCELRGFSTIGDHCRFLANVHITQHSTIGSFVWMFANVLTTNDPHPPSDTCIAGPTIDDGAVLTSGVTVLPGVRIGKMAFVASGSLVTRDVAPGRVVRGTPATVVSDIRSIRCAHGKLEHVYPWWTQFARGYPDGVVFPDGSDVLAELAALDAKV